MLNQYNPNSLFNQAKDWIAREQGKVLRNHDARAELGQTPLSILVEDIKQDPQKHIKRLKHGLASATVIMTGMSSFNPNAVAQSLTRIETNSTQVQTNPENLSVLNAEKKIVNKFVKQVFEPQGEYSSMNRGGTPQAIRNALENKGSITKENAPQIIMEAIKTNNGATNPINLKHYKAQIKMFNLNLESGYTPSEALIKSAEQCAKANPTEIKAPSIDLERLSTVAKDIQDECFDAKVDKIPGLSDTFKSQAKEEARKSKFQTNADKSRTLLKLIDQSKTPTVAPSISPTLEPKNVKGVNDSTKDKQPNQTKSTTPNVVTKSNEVFGPYNNPANPTVPAIEKPKQPLTTDFDWFKNTNQKAIEDTLKQLGIILVVGGVATIAGIKATKAVHKEYQEFKSTLPDINISEDEIRRVFWENINKIKSDYRKKKVFEAKLKGHVIARELIGINQNNVSNQQQEEFDSVFGQPSQPTFSSDVASFNLNLLRNRPEVPIQEPRPLNSTVELKSKIGQKWSNFIAGFRKSFVDITSKFIKPIIEKTRNAKLLVQTNAREKSVIADMAKQNMSRKKNSQRQEFKNESVNSNQDRIKMDKFEIPFVPQADNSSSPESILLPESMREFSNFDIQAALILTKDNLEIARKESKYSDQARKAVDFVNKQLTKHNEDEIFRKIKLKYTLPDGFEKLNIHWDRGPYKNTSKSESKNIIIEKNQCDEFTFSHYLNILDGLKLHFKNDIKIQNALDVVILFVKDQQAALDSQNRMRLELFNKKNSPAVENVNGNCQEEESSYFRLSKEFLKKYSNLSFLRSFYTDKNEVEFKLKAEPLVEKFGIIVFGTEYPDQNQKGFGLNTLDFEKLNSLLSEIKFLSRAYNIPTSKDQLSDNHRTFLDVQILDMLMESNTKVARKLQLPPNTLEFAKNIYEEDPDPFFENGIPQFNAYTKSKKYPTSLMFPNVLEKEEELLHIKSLCTRFSLNLRKAYKAVSNPSHATLEEKYALSNVMRILNDPQYKYRPFRKVNANVPQKPITIEELFLTESK